MEMKKCEKCGAESWQDDEHDDVTLNSQDMAEAMWQAAHPDAAIAKPRPGSPTGMYWKMGEFVLALLGHVQRCDEDKLPYPWESEGTDKNWWLLSYAASAGQNAMSCYCAKCRKVVTMRFPEYAEMDGRKLTKGECPECEGNLYRTMRFF